MAPLGPFQKLAGEAKAADGTQVHAIPGPEAPLSCWHLSHQVHTWSHLINVVGNLDELVFGGILVSSILLKLHETNRTR